MGTATVAGLSEEQRLFAEANGYLVIPEALDADELSR